MKISLARAFKERSRLNQRIVETLNIINDENSILEGGVRSIDVRKKFEEFHVLSSKLTDLKLAISRANAGIADKLVKLTEQKHLLTWVKNITVMEGQKCDRYTSTGVNLVYNTVIRKVEIIEETEAIQKRINQLQDEIDEFNARTQIEFEL